MTTVTEQMVIDRNAAPAFHVSQSNDRVIVQAARSTYNPENNTATTSPAFPVMVVPDHVEDYGMDVLVAVQALNLYAETGCTPAELYEIVKKAEAKNG